MLADKLTLTAGETLLVCVIGILVVMLELALIAVLVTVISRVVRSFSKKAPAAVTPPVLPVTTQENDDLTLIRTDERTAAMIMAIVSDETGVPVERLHFKSIRLLDEEGEDQ